jgi:hypothetical protein
MKPTNLPASTSRATSPGASVANTAVQANVASRPDVSDAPELDTALKSLEAPGLSPQKRFTAWTNALVLSLKNDHQGCIDWLRALHQIDGTGSNEFDAGVAPTRIDLDDLERVCTWLDGNQISLPVSIDIVGRLVSNADEMNRLATILRGSSPCVRSLRLVGGNLSNEAVDLLSQALLQSRSLRSLRLTDSALGDLTLAQVAPALKRMVFLEELDISYNQCGVHGLAAMAEAIETHQTLRKLNLSGLGAGGGLAMIFTSLGFGIEKIQLTSATYSDADAHALGLLLASTKTLKVLDMGWPSLKKDRWDGAGAMTREGRALIFDGLRRNSTLETLSIRDWKLSKTEVKALCDALLNSRCRLSALKLKQPKDADALQILRDAVSRNETLIDLAMAGSHPDWFAAHLQSNLARHAQLPGQVPGALHAIFHDGGLPLVPDDILNIIGSHLEVPEQLNVLRASHNPPPETGSTGCAIS